MDLWTEFEGVTIDSGFALNKLLQSEGRSAFFSTINARGESVLIRIVECHFDEDEILARWRGVQTLGHPNFLRIDSFGQFLIEEDGITAVYAVFERIDANLGQVLEQGCLSAADAAQIGLSIASALETLHTHGFVHEHVEPRKIFSVGETVKLRSDCIRETPEGEAGMAARRRDVHDLAVLLKQVLLGMGVANSAPQRPLAAPFDNIVRSGMNGAWGIEEIKAALAAIAPPAKAAPPARQVVSTATEKLRNFTGRPAPSTPNPRPEPRLETPPPMVAESSPRSVPRLDQPAALASFKTLLSSDSPLRRWIAPGALLVAVLLLGWFFVHRFFAGNSAPAAPVSRAARNDAPPAPSAPSRATDSSATNAGVAAHGRTEWRVVAFTYNRQDQAQKKASSLARKHPDLRPEVFSPNGRAPWLVTVGGALQRDAAYAMARKARNLGLPRDTYAQNYIPR